MRKFLAVIVAGGFLATGLATPANASHARCKLGYTHDPFAGVLTVNSYPKTSARINTYVLTFPDDSMNNVVYRKAPSTITYQINFGTPTRVFGWRKTATGALRACSNSPLTIDPA